MFIFPLSPWMLFILFLCIIAAIYGIIQNIGSIIFIAIASIVLILLLGKWPMRTFLGLMALVISGLIISGISSTAEKNNTLVCVYEATSICIFYDEKDNMIQIPEGSIVARYTDPEVKSQEEATDAHSQMCVWYYNGEIFTSSVSLRHGMADYYNERFGAGTMEPNSWNLSERKEIRYKEFKDSDWWK